MRLGSLCSGYGGLEAGLGQVLDIEPVWCSEIDKDASKVLATHHPNVPNLGDLTALDWHQVEPVDIICAGFPCQPFSHAGKRQGADDERAIFEYIAEAIGVLRPGLVVLENVPGILTLGGVSVVGTLAGLGYDARWGIVRASDTGAPHRRARWFCIAEPADADGKRSERWKSLAKDCLVGSANRREPLGESKSSLRGDGAAADASDFGHERAGDSRRRRIGSTNGSGPAADAWGCYTPAVERWERILGRPAPAPTDDRGLRPEFVEWMIGLDEGWVCDVGLSRTAALRLLGNGVLPAQAALAVDLLL